MYDEIRSYRWAEASKRYRRNNPLCVYCARAGRVTQAEVVDHIIPRTEAPQLMWEPSNWQSLCKRCHDITKAQEEFYGYHNDIDESGWPSDAQHPANGGLITQKQIFSIPHFLKPSAIPVHIVCGPSGSGKTTYIRANKKDGDILIDFDDIRESICGDRYSEDRRVLQRTFAIRAAMLKSLAYRTTGEAWFIVQAPSKLERDAWCRALGKKADIMVMTTSRDECHRRIDNDPTRKNHRNRLHARADAWFRAQNNKFFKDMRGVS